MGTKYLRSVQFISGLVQPIEPPIVGRSRGTSSRFPAAEVPARRSGVCRLGGGMVCFASCACLLVRDVVWHQSDANSAQNLLQKVRSVQFACLIGSNASSFSSVRGTASKSLRSFRSVQFIQFSSRTLTALLPSAPGSGNIDHMSSRQGCGRQRRRYTGGENGPQLAVNRSTVCFLYAPATKRCIEFF